MYDLSNVCGVDYSKSKWRKKSTKGWEFILYPDSEYYNYDWLDDLDDYHNPWCCILHDRDIYDRDKIVDGVVQRRKGELKKKHYHVYFWFGNAVKFTQALEVMETCGGCRIMPILNKSGAIRYLTHVDYPEKAQYSYDDIVSGGGLDIAKYYYEGSIDIDLVIEKVRIFLKLNKIWTTNQFLDYAAIYNKEWHRLYCNKEKLRKYVVEYCKSQGYELLKYTNSEDAAAILHEKKAIKYYKLPLYDDSGNVVLDDNGNIVADKQIMIN